MTHGSVRRASLNAHFLAKQDFDRVNDPQINPERQPLPKELALHGTRGGSRS
jgi:hypothetical protein